MASQADAIARMGAADLTQALVRSQGTEDGVERLVTSLDSLSYGGQGETKEGQ
jgi:hypothetical protein